MLRIATRDTIRRCSAVLTATALGTTVCCTQSSYKLNCNALDSVSYCSTLTQPFIDNSSSNLRFEQDSHDFKNQKQEKEKNHHSESRDGHAIFEHKDVNVLEEIRPIVEASVRAVRLVTTVVMIALEYKMDSYKLKINDVIETFGLDVLLGSVNSKELKRQKLEQNVQNKLNDLQQAQQEYAESDKDKDKVEEMQKNVHKAAEKLGQAEEDLLDFLNSFEDDTSIQSSTTVHTRAATRLRDLCRTNGGTYIKVGQHVANLDHLLPPDYINILQSLFGDCPITPYDDVREVIREELGEYPEILFQSFEKEPIASASLAQVHVAREKGTGRKLAIKVQHRGLKETSRGDLLALETVVRLVDYVFDEFKWGWIVDEIAPNLPKELDFSHEGQNAEKSAEHIKKSGLNCIVPKVHWEYTTSRILCMDFEEGYSVTDVETMNEVELNKNELSSLISSLFQAQIFESGFIHCDPHPQNVLWRQMENGRPQLILLDHGLYKQIDDDFRISYANLWKGLLMADIQQIKESCSSLGINEMYPLLSAMLMSRPFDEVIERSKTKSFTAKKRIDAKSDAAMIRGYAQQYIREIIKLLDKVPRQMLLLFKMNDCLRHIDHTLGSNPTRNLVIAGKFAVQASFGNKKNKSRLINHMKHWISYVVIMSRIKMFETLEWWIEKRRLYFK